MNPRFLLPKLRQAVLLALVFILAVEPPLAGATMEYASKSLENQKEVATFLAKFETAQKYDILWYQVKVSTGKMSEIDVFIPLDERNKLSVS